MLFCLPGQGAVEAQTAPNAGGTAIEVDPKTAFDHRLTPQRPLRMPNPRFPEEITVELIVDATGVVSSAKAIRGELRFHEAAVKEAEGWRFRPFLKDGRPVPAKFSTTLEVFPPEVAPTKFAPFPVIEHPQSILIALKRTACFGTCPVYDVEIKGDGQITYTGSRYVVVTGRVVDRISTDAVLQLVELFRRASFFSLEDEYVSGVTDNPTYAITLFAEGQVKLIVDYDGRRVGMPQAVTDLEDAIDRAASTARWIHGRAN